MRAATFLLAFMRNAVSSCIYYPRVCYPFSIIHHPIYIRNPPYFPIAEAALTHMANWFRQESDILPVGQASIPSLGILSPGNGIDQKNREKEGCAFGCARVLCKKLQCDLQLFWWQSWKNMAISYLLLARNTFPPSPAFPSPIVLLLTILPPHPIAKLHQSNFYAQKICWPMPHVHLTQVLELLKYS